MTLVAQQTQLVRLVRIRQRRIDRAVLALRQLQADLETKQAERSSCEALIARLSDEKRELRHVKIECVTAKAADWMQQEQYGIGLQHRIIDQRNCLELLEKVVNSAKDAVDQAKQQLRAMRQKLETLSAQASHHGEQVRREKSQKEQRKLDEQALGMTANGGME